MSEERLKIAVFIDFDNIEIGVKSTLNRNFDIAAVLEAIKERGEIVTKVAYGDWKRSGDYGRAMGQHAIHMVQRNLTPGGDKNGADINLALDALEMAFTRDHINAFVIVGGDSDFMTLVEKLKQYDKKVFVVGGRAFTSAILQKNCHEFIAYENLIRSVRRPSGRARSGSEVSFDKAVPLVMRGLKILTDREVSPQIGLLKSTLLQLDSTFSERDYGATSFRDFVEKLARTGVITLKHMDRSILVEPGEGEQSEPVEEEAKGRKKPSDSDSSSRSGKGKPPEVPPATPEQMDEGVQKIRLAIEKAETPPKWPMYLRTVRQLIKAYDSDFDEANHGFRGLQDALRAVQKAGFLKLERNRQGVLRILPGESLDVVQTGAAGLTPEVGVGTDPESERELQAQEARARELAEAGEAEDAVTEVVPEEVKKPAQRTTRKAKTTKAAKTKATKTTKKAAKTTKATKTTKTTRTRKATASPTSKKKVTRKKAAKTESDVFDDAVSEG